jgi:diacylglycerol kinase (ATP)
MPKEKIAFIINPHSGRRKRTNIKEAVCKALDMSRFEPEFVYTSFAGHATQLAIQLSDEGFTKIIGVGGDGTINEVASGLIGKQTCFGIIPTGSGNGLARYLGIPVRLSSAVKIINGGKTKWIDAGRINKGWFFCTCGVGFDAHVGHKFAKSSKRGFSSYIRVILSEFSKYNPSKYQFTIDGIPYKRRAFLITIANAGQYGNNAYIAPNAKIDDGFFDVCILKPFPIIKTLGLALRLFSRSIEKDRHMEVIRGKEIEFKKAKKKYTFHFDGEPVKYKRRKVKISMFPRSLEVIVKNA